MAPIDGIERELAGKRYKFRLRIAEIHRFEQNSGAQIFTVYTALFRERGAGVTTEQIFDILELGLIGAGMEEAKAEAVIESLAPADVLDANLLARALLVSTFAPELYSDIEAEQAVEDGGEDVKKKRVSRPAK